jgi:hypothetical protein
MNTQNNWCNRTFLSGNILNDNTKYNISGKSVSELHVCITKTIGRRGGGQIFYFVHEHCPWRDHVEWFFCCVLLPFPHALQQLYCLLPRGRYGPLFVISLPLVTIISQRSLVNNSNEQQMIDTFLGKITTNDLIVSHLFWEDSNN